MHHFNFGGSWANAAASLRGSGNPHLPHSTSSSLHSQQQQQKLQRHARLHVAAAAAAAAMVGAGGVHLYRQGQRAKPTQQLLKPQQQQQQQDSSSGPMFFIPKELAEVMAGAFAEIVQVAVLYPLDTIKVRCQAGGLPVAGVLQQLLAQPGTAVRQLYAGVVSASLASVVVGSLYFFTFCAAKRTATKMLAEAERNKAKPAAEPDTNNSSSSSSHMLHVQQQLQAHMYPHGAAADYHYDPVFASICSDDAAAKAAAAAAAAPTTATPMTPAASSSSSNTSKDAALSSQGRLQANVLAATAAALIGAVVEAPVELFKHRAQVGQVQGSMLAAMLTALKHQGPGALYGSFFLPFCFKSLPFDIGELMTYSTLQDWKERQTAAAAAAPPAAAAAVKPLTPQQQEEQQPQQLMLALGSITASSNMVAAGSSSSSSNQIQQALADMPDHVWDMAAGAAAGAAAVLVSMPPDCVKTVLETGGGIAAKPGSGAIGSIAAFAATGKQLVQQRGVAGGLFMGLAPRLVESVPSTMLYWLAVEGARRVLEPYTAK